MQKTGALQPLVRFCNSPFEITSFNAVLQIERHSVFGKEQFSFLPNLTGA